MLFPERREKGKRKDTRNEENLKLLSFGNIRVITIAETKITAGNAAVKSNFFPGGYSLKGN